jgi:hypothetical protein
MERLDQGHLHPKLEVPELTGPGRELNPGLPRGGEHSRKEPFEQLVIVRSREYIFAASSVGNMSM